MEYIILNMGIKVIYIKELESINCASWAMAHVLRIAYFSCVDADRDSASKSMGLTVFLNRRLGNH